MGEPTSQWPTVPLSSFPTIIAPTAWMCIEAAAAAAGPR